MREDAGGVLQGLAVRVFEARVAGGVLGSGAKASSVNIQGLCSSEKGTADMEMERPWVLAGCTGLGELLELEGGRMGENASLSCWGSELQEPELGLGSPPVSLALFRQERAAVRRERSSELEPRRRIVSCNSELDICSNPSTEIFPAAAMWLTVSSEH